jgi:tetratricopeptide (TPR) repeat protein
MIEGETLENQGDYSNAKQQFRLALDALEAGAADARQFRTGVHLAVVTAQLGEYSEAEQWGTRAVRSGTAIYGADSPELVLPLMNLAMVYGNENQFAKAEETAQRTLTLLAKGDAQPSPALAATLGVLGTILHRRGNLQKSEEVLRQSVDIAEKLPVAYGNLLAENLANLGVLCRETARPSEAVSLFNRAYVLYRQAYGETHPEIVPILTVLAVLKADEGSYEEAIAQNEQALRLAENAWGPNPPLIHDALLAEASWLRKLHRKNEAKALESRAKAIEKIAAENNQGRYTVDVRDLAMVKGAKP